MLITIESDKQLLNPTRDSQLFDIGNVGRAVLSGISMICRYFVSLMFIGVYHR